MPLLPLANDSISLVIIILPTPFQPPVVQLEMMLKWLTIRNNNTAIDLFDTNNAQRINANNNAHVNKSWFTIRLIDSISIEYSISIIDR